MKKSDVDRLRERNIEEMNGALKFKKWLMDFILYIDMHSPRGYDDPGEPFDASRGSITPEEFLVEVRSHVAGHPNCHPDGIPYPGPWSEATDPVDEFCALCMLELIANGSIDPWL